MTSPKRLVGLGLSTLGLCLGVLGLGRALEAVLDKNPARLNKRETVMAGLLIGLPTTWGALWMLGDLERDRQLTQSTRLQVLFYKALQANNGKISAVQLAMLAEVSLADAEYCLEDWAGSLNAELQIDESGVRVYHFDLP